MTIFKKLAAATALALCALAPTAAFATKVLYLSTAEFSYSYDGTDNSTLGNPDLTYQTITGGIDKAAAEACDGEGKKTQNRGGAVPFMLGGTRASDENKGALLALKEAVGESNFFGYPGVLSREEQIEQAKCFNGEANCTYRQSGEKFDARNKWNEALSKFDELGEGDIVVVHSIYQIIDSGKAAQLVEKIAEQANKEEKDRITFILLLDTCSACSYDSVACEPSADGIEGNLHAIADETVFENNNWDLKVAHLGHSQNYTTPTNSASPYAEKVTGLDALMGNTSGALMCMPKQNVIFPAPTPQEQTSYKFDLKDGIQGRYCSSSSGTCEITGTMADDIAKWPELTPSSSFGTLIPFWQNNAGKGGACIYIGQDGNIFDNGRRAQHESLAKMFLSLPTPITGACNVKREDAGICAGLKPSQKCVLAPVPAGATVTNPDVIPSREVKNGEIVEDPLMCTAKVWEAQCVPEKLAEAACGAGETQGTEDCCCAAENIATSTDSEGNETKTCCTAEGEKPTGDAGKQKCCPEGSVLDKGGECCPTGALKTDGSCCAEEDAGKDPADPEKKLCCGADMQDSSGMCCGGATPQPTPTAAGGTMCCPDGQEDDGTGKCAAPCTGGKQRQADGSCKCTGDTPDEVGGTCFPVCPAGKVHQADGACVCSGERRECAAGQIVDGDCGCKCNLPYDQRPVCKAGEVPAPYEKSGAKSGSAIDTKAAGDVACCRPAPAASAPVPTTGWPALLGLGVLLPLLARRQRRQGKRRDDDAS